MSKRILAAYVSKHGATKEMAERIAEVLRRSGLDVDVSSPNGYADRAAGCDAVVFGSAVYFGSWPKKAIAFLHAWEKLAVAPPIWLFFSGPTGNADPKAQTMRGQGIPERQRHVIERIKPRDIAFFRGKIDAAQLNFLESWALRNVKAPLGDFRDWDAISSWATTIAEAIRRQT
jgi:menaquinone-dependent protoporphyrinogen oxidase